MSLPAIDEHICINCGKTRPSCGRVRQVKEGYCTIWEPLEGVLSNGGKNT